MAHEFAAIDVETANADLASVCQVGVVTFADGEAQTVWESLVNPEDFFDPFNVAVHGIGEEHVRDAPKYPELASVLHELLANRVVVSHMPFDRLALQRLSEKYGVPVPQCTWLDSAKVVRRAWPQFSRSGYALANCAAELGISFQHHVASEDARAAGLLVSMAIEETGLAIEDWLSRVNQPIAGSYPSKAVAREGSPDGPLAGEVAVFTGALTISRSEAADLAADAGCSVAKGVTRQTTLLIVGDQDIRRLAGDDKSSKHRKAESLIESGQYIRILGEADFKRVIGYSE